MSALGHVLEAAGLTTIALGSIRSQMANTAPPRGLYCDFPLGRPLGIPGDAPFQTAVIEQAFDIVESATEPILVDYAESVPDTSDTPLSCALPPRTQADADPAVDEAIALRAAYDRAVAEHGNRIGVSREITVDQIPDAVRSFSKIAAGTAMADADVPGNPMRVAQDVRGFYVTAALALADHTPGAWAAESWFYEQTEAGRTLLAARAAVKESGAKFHEWFYLAPGDR